MLTVMRPSQVASARNRSASSRWPLPLVLAAIGGLAYALVARLRQLHWGATAEEAGIRLPGDDLVPDARYVTTRAVTVRAPAAAIWPWLVQMGQGRAGFYTY